MPRKNHRAKVETFHAKTILGDDYKFTRDPELAAERKARREARAKTAFERMRAAHKREWGKCIVPGCDFQVPRKLRSGIEFPVCTLHAVAVWEDIEGRIDEPEVQQATAALRSRREAIRADLQAEEEAAGVEYQRHYREIGRAHV